MVDSLSQAATERFLQSAAWAFAQAWNSAEDALGEESVPTGFFGDSKHFRRGLQSNSRPEKEPDAPWFCWAALALDYAGTALRRQEKTDEARTLHRAAYTLRRARDSSTACAESAFHLAQDALVARRPGEAEHWLNRAWAHLDSPSPAVEDLRIDILTARAHLFLQTNRLSEALADARAVRRMAGDAQAATAKVPRADLLVARALLECAGTGVDDPSATAERYQEEAEDLLLSARDALAAFGVAEEDGVRQADELLDLLSRLKTIGLPSHPASVPAAEDP